MIYDLFEDCFLTSGDISEAERILYFGRDWPVRLSNIGTKPETSTDLVPPFVDWTKTGIAARGINLDLPYELG